MNKIKILLSLIFTFTLSSALFPQGVDKMFTVDKTQRAWASEQLEAMSIDQKIGQLIVATTASDITDNEKLELANQIKTYFLSGYVLTEGSPIKQAELANFLQDQSVTPLMFAFNSVGAEEVLFNSAYGCPWNITIAAASDRKAIQALGQQIARQYRRLGVNLNYTTTVNLINSDEDPYVSKNSFGSKMTNVKKKGAPYFEGLQAGGVMGNVKYLLGYGNVDNLLAQNNKKTGIPEGRFHKMELPMFRFFINKGVGSVTIGNTNLPVIDSNPDVPMSLSPTAVQSFLVKDWNFDGLIINNMDYTRRAILERIPAGEAEVRAIEAGNDIVMIPDGTREVVEALRKAVNSGRITEERLDRSVWKILMLKYWMGLYEVEPISSENLYADLYTQNDLDVTFDVMQSAMTLIQNKFNNIPLKAEKLPAGSYSQQVTTTMTTAGGRKAATTNRAVKVPKTKAPKEPKARPNPAGAFGARNTAGAFTNRSTSRQSAFTRNPSAAQRTTRNSRNSRNTSATTPPVTTAGNRTTGKATAPTQLTDNDTDKPTQLIASLDSNEKNRIVWVTLGEGDVTSLKKYASQYAEITFIDGKGKSAEQLRYEVPQAPITIVSYHTKDNSPATEAKISTADRRKIAQLASRPQSIFVCYEAPAALSDWEEYEDYSTILIAYQNTLQGQVASVCTIFGVTAPKGSLPHDISQKYRRGLGYSFSPITKSVFSLPIAVLAKGDTISLNGMPKGLTYMGKKPMIILNPESNLPPELEAARDSIRNLQTAASNTNAIVLEGDLRNFSKIDSEADSLIKNDDEFKVQMADALSDAYLNFKNNYYASRTADEEPIDSAAWAKAYLEGNETAGSEEKADSSQVAPLTERQTPLTETEVLNNKDFQKVLEHGGFTKLPGLDKDGVVFCVQIVAGTRPLVKGRDWMLDSMPEAQVYIEYATHGKYTIPLFKYYVGPVRSYTEAQELLEDAKKKGVKDAFIISFNKGRKMDVKTALEMTK